MAEIKEEVKRERANIKEKQEELEWTRCHENFLTRYIFTERKSAFDESKAQKIKLRYEESELTFNHMILTTSDKIAKGHVVDKINNEAFQCMRDPLVDTLSLQQLESANQMYAFLVITFCDYYRHGKANGKANIIMIEDKNKNRYFQTIKNIEEGEELLYCHGIGPWLTDKIIPYLKVATLPGYVQFCKELSNSGFEKDQYERNFSEFMVLIGFTSEKILANLDKIPKLNDRNLPGYLSNACKQMIEDIRAKQQEAQKKAAEAEADRIMKQIEESEK
jgi:hypothetical protein